MSSNDWTTEHETDPETRGSHFQRDHGYVGCLRMHNSEAVIDRLNGGRLVVHVSCPKCDDWTALVALSEERSWFLRGHE
jgi:hypothetical protein